MADNETDRRLDILSEDECLTLMRTQEIGRLGILAERDPLIIPVNYGLDGRTIVLRLDQATKLAITQDANMAFEIDEIDRSNRTGWSVLVRGLAEEITPAHRAELIERSESAGVHPWAPGEHGHWVRLVPRTITGRRIVPGELPPAFEPAGYL
jgi:uncharacterized protein